MKLGFARRDVIAPPVEIKPEPVPLPTPLKVETAETRPWWMVVVAIFAIGLVGGMVVVSFASGARTFNGGMAFFPIFTVGGILMLLGGRFMGSGRMSRGKMDQLRARFSQVLDELRVRVGWAADALDCNYRWYHPPVQTLDSAIGGARMWERKPDGRDTWFGVARVGVGMTALHEAGAVSFAEPQDMPTKIEMEPATGKALQEFVRYQSVAYRTPALISLLVEPGYRLAGGRDQVLALMRSVLCQLTFSHGPDHLRLMIVTDDVPAWDWVKWLPHAGDERIEDAAGPVRMVYQSVQQFSEAQHSAVIKGRDAFTHRHAASKDPVKPLPHTVIISDVADAAPWYGLTERSGVAGVTFFDLRGGVPPCQGGARLLRIDETGVIDAVARDASTWAAHEEQGLTFFALADLVSYEEAQRFAQLMARWRLAQPYEDLDERLGLGEPRDILSYYGIDDPAEIDFNMLWGPRSDINSAERLRIPFANRKDNGKLLVVDLKDMNQGGDGPHGVMSGTTGSGKTTALRTVVLSAILGHPPQNVQMVLADCKGGSGVKPFEGVPHVAHIITDLEEDQALMDRFIDAMWGEIARRKAICNAAGADDADEYNLIRAEQARKGAALAPLPVLLVVLDEFKEFFRLKANAQEVLDQICRQGRSYWVHLLMASQDIDTRAEKLLENVGYRMVLRANTSASASAAGVPAAVNLPKEVGLGYLRLGPADQLAKFKTESLWREYRKPGSVIDDEVVDVSAYAADYIEPQLFSTAIAPLRQAQGAAGDEVVEQAAGNEDGVDPDGDEVEDDNALRKPKVGRVIIDQLRRIDDFEPYRLWQPPLSRPRTVDEVVQMYLGRRWDADYAANANLVFPLGVIDRPYKHDQQPLLVDAAGGGNVLVVGGQGSGKTTTLQALICAAAMTHNPEQVQFYCMALSSPALGTIGGLPHVGSVAYGTDEDGLRRTLAEVLELLDKRMRSFPACQLSGVEQFRRRKFGGEGGEVPDDGYGDVFLVVDNYGALNAPSSTLRTKEWMLDQLSKLIQNGRSFGIHVVASVERYLQLAPQVRESWPQKIELKLAAPEDAKVVRPLQAAKVPAERPGRGMVPQNYVREGFDPVGLHTMMARPALAGTEEAVFDSAGVVAAVRAVAAGLRPALPVRRLPERIELGQLRELAAQRGHAGVVWAVDEFDNPVGLRAQESPFLVVAGLDDCGRRTLCATLMSEIGRVYAPGSSRATQPAQGGVDAEFKKLVDDPRPRAQVWLIDPARELLRVLGSDYLEQFAYRVDQVKGMAHLLAQVLAERLPRKGLSVEESLAVRWSGPEIFLIVHGSERLAAGIDAPLYPLVDVANAATDVGLRVIYTRRFGGFMSSQRADPLLGTMWQANPMLLVMDSNIDEGFIRGRWRGHPMPPGRGFLMDTAESGRYVQVGWVSAGQQEDRV